MQALSQIESIHGSRATAYCACHLCEIFVLLGDRAALEPTQKYF